MQCSPLAHTSLKTFPNGTLRFSFGYNETIKDVDYCLKLIKEFFSEE